MIKARLRLGSRETLFFGLTEENMSRLHNGQTILVDGLLVGLAGMQFLFVAGQTEDDVRAKIRALQMVPAIKPDPMANP